MSRLASRIVLAVLFVGLSFFIVVQSYLHKDGFLTSDSSYYLQIAQNLVNGDGLTTTNTVDGMSTYFATWPSGYPLLIAGVSLTGISVFWASKIVNIVMLGLSLLLIERLFKEKAYLIGLVFLVSTLTEVMVYTWSEVPFLFGLVWLAYSIIRYRERRTVIFAVQMGLAALFLFLMRYIGLFGAGVVGLIGFGYLFQKKWRPMLVCWIAGSIPILLAGMYLWINFTQTGELTGMPRIERPESNWEFLVMLWSGIKAELNLFSVSSTVYWLRTVVVVGVAFVVFVRLKPLVELWNRRRNVTSLTAVFAFIGLVYFAAIIFMRATSQFDPFNFRLLAPSTFMLWIALLSWVTEASQRYWSRMRWFFLTLFAMMLYMNVWQQSMVAYESTSPTYGETRATMVERYSEIPADSIVVFEDIHARYLRTDVQYVKPHFKPYFAKKESVDEFIERITPNQAEGMYIHVRPVRADRYHESFVKFMEDHEDETFVQVEDKS